MVPLAEPGKVSNGELQQERLDERDEVARLATVVQDLEAKVLPLDHAATEAPTVVIAAEANDSPRKSSQHAEAQGSSPDANDVSKDKLHDLEKDNISEEVH
ncbi:hypothetical protein HPB50_017579 [Hyalomma asiaticum]|uniref:Uncharacterized protein n=1 Tax=Hyalomma asiaticum TaxID=266040 RepID=A0ACB7SM11_HYAAI|nr:hypothetical protein HPB50_017579 [Hyalomma asiaticum]